MENEKTACASAQAVLVFTDLLFLDGGALDHPVGSAADSLGALQSGDVGLFADLLHGLFGALGTLGDHLVDLLVGGHQIFLLCDLQQSHAGTGVLLGTVVTGKNGPLLGAASSALLNALKKLAGIDHEIDLVSARAIEPIQTLKTNYLGSRNPRLHTDEILIALSSSAAENETAAVALQQLSKLKGCDMHSTVILSSVDTDTIKRLGMYLTCEPAYEQEDRKYHKK